MRSPHFRLLYCLSLAAAMFAAAASAFAYDTIGNGLASKWGDDPYPGSGAIVTWGYVPDGTPASATAEGVDGTSNLSQIRDSINTNFGAGAFEAAIERAFATWSAAANITFVGPITDPGNPLGATGAADPMIRVGAYTLNYEYWGAPGAIGIGPPGFGGYENFPYSGDVILNLARPFYVATGVEDVTQLNGQNGEELEGLFLHELGHAAIGLNHPDWVSEDPDRRVMYVGDPWGHPEWPVCCQTINHELHPDDIAAAQYVYGIRGDFNRDGFVDAADYTLWRDTQGSEVTSGTGADGNVDGVVDMADFEVWQSHFGDLRLAGFGEQTPNFGAAVPEPATAAMALFGVVTLAARARRFSSRREGLSGRRR
ncbi:MAG: dockerin type I domain-containing protein [Pirellulales bacterium]